MSLAREGRGIHEISEIVRGTARAAGFDLAGISPVRDFSELEYFPEWIAAGRAGEMKYLEARDVDGRLQRRSLRAVAPWARSVVVGAINYNTEQPYSSEPGDSGRGWISRYAWSREDYHDSVMRRLRVVEAKVLELGSEGRQDTAQTAGSAPALPTRPETLTRCYVDTGPLVERVYAKYAGVGWIGKNTCVLNQKMGSWLFLGVILTSLELEADLPAPDRCGTCTRCLDACPTNALVGPHQLDSNRCISYLTIEKRGEIPGEMRGGMGRHVFGCDICQDVCPWNRKAPATGAPEFQPREGLVNPALEWLAEMTADEFRQKFRGSPVRRAKLSGLRRNTVIAMGNSGNRQFVGKLERLQADADPVVAESARWALKQVSTSS
ncbi:MAG TPA: tRNA epoxyqueuosine(34) reductase QueG [Terriglobales bacterium]|nr:tRNA epoxyqueuosine(34) reductase QueG [Terriglobales bacterium]